MKRGNTLVEMVVSLAILAVAVSISLRLLFTMDWALGDERQQLSCTAGYTQLLDDLGADVRAAHAATATRDTLDVRDPAEVRYYWDERLQATVRRAAAPEAETTVYPHVRASFAGAKAMLRVRVRSEDTNLRTAYYLRNR